MRIFGTQAVCVGVIFSLFYLSKWSTEQGVTSLILLTLGMLLGTAVAVVDDLVLAPKYTEPGMKVRPISRSMFILLALVPLGLYVLTSTASVLSLGFYFGFSCFLIMEMFSLYSKPAELHERFLWQMTERWAPESYQWFVTISLAVLGLFTILFIW